MAMTRKKRRMALLGVGGALTLAAAGVMSFAFQDTIAFFDPPTEMLAKDRGPDQRQRVGGLVVENSVMTLDDGGKRFDITDNETDITVVFAGILPDLFREGQGIIAEGYLRNGVFEADEVLAKHDEKYMPAEVAEGMKGGGA